MADIAEIELSLQRNEEIPELLYNTYAVYFKKGNGYSRRFNFNFKYNKNLIFKQRMR